MPLNTVIEKLHGAFSGSGADIPGLQTAEIVEACVVALPLVPEEKLGDIFKGLNVSHELNPPKLTYEKVRARLDDIANDHDRRMPIFAVHLLGIIIRARSYLDPAAEREVGRLLNIVWDRRHRLQHRR